MSPLARNNTLSVHIFLYFISARSLASSDLVASIALHAFPWEAVPAPACPFVVPNSEVYPDEQVQY